MNPSSMIRNPTEAIRAVTGSRRDVTLRSIAGGDPVEVLSMVRSFLENERENVGRYDLPWWKRLWCYRHGFYSYSGVIYELDRRSVDRYLSDLERRKATAINQAHWKVAQLKLAFNRVLAHSHPHLLTDVVATIQDGEVYPLPSAASTAATPGELLDDMADGSRLIAKPAGGWAGSGIFSFGLREEGFTLDGEPVDREALARRLGDLDGYIVERAVGQADYAASIYPHSANTLRIVTMIDPETREPFVGAAVHRFGTDESRPVDNWSAGGVCAAIDVETGVLGPATAKPKSGSPTFLREHPDTGTAIEGSVIPEWDTVRADVLSVAAEYRHLWRYLGWDVVVTDESGSFAVLEANARPDVDLMQIHEPLLDDPRVKRFYRYHGVI